MLKWDCSSNTFFALCLNGETLQLGTYLSAGKTQAMVVLVFDRESRQQDMESFSSLKMESQREGRCLKKGREGETGWWEHLEKQDQCQTLWQHEGFGGLLREAWTHSNSHTHVYTCLSTDQSWMIVGIPWLMEISSVYGSLSFNLVSLNDLKKWDEKVV